MPRLHPAAMLDPKAVRRLQRTLSQPFFHTWDQFPVIGTPQHYLRSHRHRPLSARAPTVGATSADGRSSAVQSAASVREPKEDASTEQGTVPIALHCMNSELQDYLEDSEWLRDLSWSENTSEASPPVPVRHFLRRAGLQASTSDGGGGSLASSAAATRAHRRRVSSLGTAHDEDSAADLQDGEAWLSDESDPVLPPAPPALVYATNQAGERMVVWGTLAALIDELAPLQETDINYVQDFMITYEYVTTAPVLMERLLARYSFLPAEGLSQEQLTLHNSWRGPIRLKIINVLKFWMEVRFHDFQNDDNIFRLLVHFLNRIEHSGNERWANQLRLIVQKNVDKPLPQILVKNASPELLITAIRKSTTLFGTHKHKLRKIKNSFTGQELVQWLVNAQGLPHRQHAVVNATKLLETNLIEPIGTSSKRKFQDNKDLYVLKEVEGPPEVAVTYKKPLLPKHFEKSKTTYFTFMDLSSEEMARQLTLLEFSLLKKVTAPEIQSQNWTKNKKRAPNISAVIKHFNKMGQWVATEVLTTSVKENREAVIRKFIEIADHLREMQNYSTCLAIMSGLSHTSVSRLKRTWKSIPKKSRELLNDLYRLIRPDDNYASYRAALAASNPPVIPYLGLWLRDLTHIEDGMPSEDEHHRFNFHKLRLIGDIFLSIRACQENPYPFEEVEMIQKYLTTGLWVENEKALFQMSLKCEPREQTPSRSPSWRHSVFTKPKKKCGNSGNGSAGSDTCTASTSSLNETPDRMRKLTQVLGTELERGHPKKPPSRKSRSGQKRVSIAKTPEIREVPKSPSPLPRKQSGPTRTSSQKLRKFFGEATPAPPLASPAPLQSLSPPVGRREQRQASRSRRRSGSAISASSEMRVRALSPKTNRRSPLATASSSSGESSENSSIPTRSLPSSSASSYSGRDLSETDLSDDSSDAHSSSSSNHNNGASTSTSASARAARRRTKDLRRIFGADLPAVIRSAADTDGAVASQEVRAQRSAAASSTASTSRGRKDLHRFFGEAFPASPSLVKATAAGAVLEHPVVDRAMDSDVGRFIHAADQEAVMFNSSGTSDYSSTSEGETYADRLVHLLTEEEAERLRTEQQATVLKANNHSVAAGSDVACEEDPSSLDEVEQEVDDKVLSEEEQEQEEDDDTDTDYTESYDSDLSIASPRGVVTFEVED